MRAEKAKQHDYYENQPTNKPPAIAKAIVALAADEANHGIGSMSEAYVFQGNQWSVWAIATSKRKEHMRKYCLRSCQMKS